MDSASLVRHGKAVESVFDLLGRDENDLTAALGFALAHSGTLLRLVLDKLLPGVEADDVMLRLETRGELGRTDLEIDARSHLVVIEAKRGWLLPNEVQWEQYAPLVTKRGAGVLVSLSEASPAWASQILPSHVQGVQVMHLPWSSIRSALDTSRIAARGQERWYLDEFQAYVRRAVPMRDPADSWTYCVAVSNDKPGGGGARTFRDLFLPNPATFILSSGGPGGRKLRRIFWPFAGMARFSGYIESLGLRLFQTCK